MGGLGCLASSVCLSGLLLGSKHSAQALANWRFRPVQKGLRGRLIESIDVSLRGVLGWGREIMSMCRRSQKSACAADHGRPSCRTRVPIECKLPRSRVVRHQYRDSLLFKNPLSDPGKVPCSVWHSEGLQGLMPRHKR